MNPQKTLVETQRDSRADGAERIERLFVRWREQGDRRAREELIERFMPLARKLASRYRNPHEPFDDLSRWP